MTTTHDSVKFNSSNLKEKFDILYDISNRIAIKYISTNSKLQGFTVEDVTQELGTLSWNLLVNDPSLNLGWYVKCLYNKVVDLYRKAKSTTSINTISLSGGYEDNNSEDGFIRSEIASIDRSTNDEAVLKLSSKLGTTEDIDLSITVNSFLEELSELDPLSLKYVVLKLVYNHIEVDSKYLHLIDGIVFDDLNSEYDFVLALGHYKSPKSGSWYGKKDQARKLLLDLLR